MTTWVLLRGLGREAAHWHDLPARLAARTGDRVLTPDLPGIGQEMGRRSPWTIRGMARDVAGRVATERTAMRAPRADSDAEPLVVVGHSLGGMVALRWAELGAAGNPAVPAVARIVVIGTSLGRLSAPWRRMRFGMMPTLARTALARDPRRREALVLDLTSTVAGGRREAVLDEREPVARARPMPRGVALRQLVAAGTERGPRPGSVRTPMLVIAGGRDRLVDPGCSRAVARAFGAELAECPAAGHDVPLDDSDWLLDQLVGAAIPA